MKRRIFLKLTAIVVGFALPITLVSISLKADKIDMPTKGSDVEYSVKKNKENLIEIFSDGLDYRYLEDLLVDNKDFKDFLLIRQFANQGKSTALSLPVIFGEYKDYSYWKILKNSKIFNAKNKYFDLVYSKTFAETMVKHMNELDNDIDFNKTIIHPINAAQDTTTSANGVGDYLSIKKRDNKINVVNWAQAKDEILNNGWGIKKLSANGFAYEYATDLAKKSIGNKPARVLINDMISHKRYFDSSDDGFDPIEGNIASTYYALQNYWRKYFLKLKTIKNSQGTSAYDNSMIVIYGDHGNHDSYNGTGKIGDILHKENSFLMIKYPHFNNPNLKPTLLEDVTVFGPDIKHIISDYFKNKSQYIDNKTPNPSKNKMLQFLQTNRNFKKDKLMINVYGYQMQFNNRHELIKLKYDRNSEDENFDPSKIKDYWGWK